MKLSNNKQISQQKVLIPKSQLNFNHMGKYNLITKNSILLSLIALISAFFIIFFYFYMYVNKESFDITSNIYIEKHDVKEF